MRFSFFLGEALGSMRRNWVMAMAAVITVFISLAILGGVLTTRFNLNQGATSLEHRVLIEVFIKDSANTPAGIKAMQAKIVAMPEVQQNSVTYISKEEALQRFKKTFGAAITDSLNTNPLPASFEIKVKDPKQVDLVASRFFNDPAVANSPNTHDGVRYAKQTVRKMLGTINLVEKAMLAVIVIFSVAAILLVSTTVRLSIFARRREVEIMRLVGATNWFIRWPFVLEGFITGVLGALLAGIVVWVSNWAIKNWVTSTNINFLKLRVYGAWWQTGTWPLGMLPTLVLLGAVLGALGSLVALRRHLRV